MKIYGIICEYNPFHSGHKHQIDLLRQADPTCGIVCMMSGNFVQRGMPAIFDKSHRAQAAIACGADLVLELPVTAALSSAEGFAAEGVRLLGNFCNYLSFGAENPDIEVFNRTAQALLSDRFRVGLKTHLESGVSFPAARQKALEDMGIDSAFLNKPNNILAVEYCKAILEQNLAMQPASIYRQGDYHDKKADQFAPSASAVRFLMEQEKPWLGFIPDAAGRYFENASIHTLAYGERAILAKLRTMTDEAFETLPYGSEGLWRKLMKNARTKATLEEVIAGTKSKRYTRSRLDRMVMCAFLELDAEAMATPAPYSRALAFNDRGREILLKARMSGQYPNIGETICHPFQEVENRCDSLYSLFAKDLTDPADISIKRRVFYLQNRKSTE